MTDALLLLLGAGAVLALMVGPTCFAVRRLGASWLLVLALAPAAGLGLAALAAIAAPFAGLRWGPLPFALASLLLIGAAEGLRRLGVRLPETMLAGRLMPPRTVRWAPLWVMGAAAVAVVPIARAAGSADAILERWDTLYHLSALQRIRETGTGSSLAVGSVSNTTGAPTFYPAAAHDLISLVPGVPIPVLLNGAVLALAIVPWALGIALLARVLLLRIPWAPFAAAVLALLAPASPADEWVHLSAIPNLIGFAALPGLLAAAVALWRSLLADDAPRLVRASIASALVLSLGGIGLALAQPNVAVTALLLLAVLTFCDALPRAGRAPWLLALPLLLLAPIGVLAWTPLGSTVTDFVGGLQVPWWNAVGEVVLGLLTVWPMALGMVIAALWWPGLVTFVRGEHRWFLLAWAVLVVLYLDAAVDSPLNLSVLFYRGQDRLAMPLTMVSCVLAVAGLRVWADALGRPDDTGRRPGATRPVVVLLVAAAVVAACWSYPPRLENAQKNFALEYPGRGRFLQADELAAWARVDPQMDHAKKVLASPFSGAAHMYAIYGQAVQFPVAGMTLQKSDGALVQSVPLAATSPKHCQNFRDFNIGYVYVDRISYQYSPMFNPLQRSLDGLGRVVFETDHSVLIEIDCTATEDGATGGRGARR